MGLRKWADTEPVCPSPQNNARRGGETIQRLVENHSAVALLQTLIKLATHPATGEERICTNVRGDKYCIPQRCKTHNNMYCSTKSKDIVFPVQGTDTDVF